MKYYILYYNPDKIPPKNSTIIILYTYIRPQFEFFVSYIDFFPGKAPRDTIKIGKVIKNNNINTHPSFPFCLLKKWVLFLRIYFDYTLELFCFDVLFQLVGVQGRNMKMDFNTGGTSRQVGQ